MASREEVLSQPEPLAMGQDGFIIHALNLAEPICLPP
jgi:hypothetical protein